MKQGLKTALVVLGVAVAAAPFWVALTIPFDDFAPPPASPKQPPPSSSKEILVDLTKWDAATTQARRAAAQDVARRVPDFALLRLETFSCGGQTHEVAIYSHARTGLEFVLVPGGRLDVDRPESDPHRLEGETRRTLNQPSPFLVSRTEVTQRAWTATRSSNPSKSRGPDLPVHNVAHEDARSFCRAADLRLPTEAEWEWACRAGVKTTFCFGDDEAGLGDYAWTAENSSGALHPVAQKRPNAFGLFDVHGNAWEWCDDWFHSDSDLRAAANSATNRLGNQERACRGGSFERTAQYASAFSRLPGRASWAIGLRPAKTVPTE